MRLVSRVRGRAQSRGADGSLVDSLLALLRRLEGSAVQEASPVGPWAPSPAVPVSRLWSVAPFRKESQW